MEDDLDGRAAGGGGFLAERAARVEVAVELGEVGAAHLKGQPMPRGRRVFLIVDNGSRTYTVTVAVADATADRPATASPSR